VIILTGIGIVLFPRDGELTGDEGRLLLLLLLLLLGEWTSTSGVGDGLMLAAPYMSSRSAKEEATLRTERLWIPFLVGLRNGPSTCAPRDSAPSCGRREEPEGPR
jgi:hypothetical protein